MRFGSFVGDHGGFVGLTSGFDSRSHAARLIGDQVLAALHKLFPLCPPAINHLATALDVLADLLLALFDQDAGLFGRLTGAIAQVLSAFFRTGYQILTSFPSALGSVQNPHQGAYAQTCQKPCHTMNLVFFCHDETLLSLSIGRLPERIKIPRRAAN